MYQVIKRDGKTVDFDLSKISAAIQKAFDALQKQYNQNIIDMLALKVTADYEPKIKDEKIYIYNYRNRFIITVLLLRLSGTEIPKRICS